MQTGATPDFSAGVRAATAANRCGGHGAPAMPVPALRSSRGLLGGWLQFWRAEFDYKFGATVRAFRRTVASDLNVALALPALKAIGFFASHTPTSLSESRHKGQSSAGCVRCVLCNKRQASSTNTGPFFSGFSSTAYGHCCSDSGDWVRRLRLRNLNSVCLIWRKNCFYGRARNGSVSQGKSAEIDLLPDGF